jgi:hypothetical protein
MGMVKGVGVGWVYEICCVLSREGDVVAWVLRLVYGGGGLGLGLDGGRRSGVC